MASKRYKNFFQIILSLGILVVFAYWVSVSRPQAANDLKVYFLDVGQGDAAYIKTPGGQDILIDGGPDNSVLYNLGKVMDFGDQKIDLVILSHPHADHLNGLLQVLDRYDVGEVWETGVEYSSGSYQEWKDRIKKMNIADKKVRYPDKKEIGGLSLTILYPLSSLENKVIDNVNNASIINRLDFKKTSILFTGDAEKEVQNQILGENIFADVLKVAHHGSENGLSESFLKAVRPAIAVISVGAKNNFGHPSPDTINLLLKNAIQIYRTDQNGTIELQSDGESYFMKTAL